MFTLCQILTKIEKISLLTLYIHRNETIKPHHVPGNVFKNYMNETLLNLGVKISSSDLTFQEKLKLCDIAIKSGCKNIIFGEGYIHLGFKNHTSLPVVFCLVRSKENTALLNEIQKIIVRRINLSHINCETRLRTNESGFAWRSLSGTDPNPHSSDMNWGGFSGGGNPFRK